MESPQFHFTAVCRRTYILFMFKDILKCLLNILFLLYLTYNCIFSLFGYLMARTSLVSMAGLPFPDLTV